MVLWAVAAGATIRSAADTLAVAPASVPMQQTRMQKELLDRTIPIAAAASQRVQASVLKLIDDPLTRRYLEQLDSRSGLHALPATVLRKRFWDALNAAELVHSFGDGDAKLANCGFDMSVAMGERAKVFYNQWQLQALGLVPVDAAGNIFTEWSEVHLFHFPPFNNESRPDLATASDRPFYAAVNMYRGSGGNPQCGPVAAVLSRAFVAERILAAPVDTGFFQGACGDGQSTGRFGNVQMPVCNAWPTGSRLLGVPPYLSHLVEPYLFFYNESQGELGESYVNMNLARLLVRLLSPYTYANRNGTGGLPLNFVENALGYLEMNPVVPIVFPHGVKLMIGMHELLWGTDEGNQLRAWCIQQGWPLAWASNPTMSYFRCGPAGGPDCKLPARVQDGGDRANVRILDPIVLGTARAGHNFSTFVNREAVVNFRAAWAATNVSSNSSTRASVAASWRALVDQMFESLAVEPLLAGACASTECIGVSIVSRACVCPS